MWDYPLPSCIGERKWRGIFYLCRIKKGLHPQNPSMRDGISLLLEETCTFRGNWRKFEGVKDELEGCTHKSLAKPRVCFKVNTVYSCLPLSFQALPPRPRPSPVDVLLPFSWKTGAPSPLLRHQSCSHLGWRPSFSLSLHGVDQVSVRLIKRNNIDRIFQLSRFGPLRK